jgi:hypothetical protein
MQTISSPPILLSWIVSANAETVPTKNGDPAGRVDLSFGSKTPSLVKREPPGHLLDRITQTFTRQR